MKVKVIYILAYMTNLIIYLREFTSKNNKILFFIYGVIYRLCLDFYYISTVSPLYSYGGLELNPDGIKYIISWVIYLLVYSLIPKQENSISSFFLNLQFVIIFAPMSTYFSLNNQSTVFLLMVSLCIIIQVWILRQKQDELKINFNLLNIQKYISTFMIIFIPVIILIIVLWGGFYGLNAFNLTYLYKIREKAEYPIVLSYLICWLPDAIIPFYLAYNLYTKRYLVAGCLVVADILLYMVIGQKFIYLSLIIIIVIFIFSKLRLLINSIYIGLSSLCFISSVLYILDRYTESSRISELIATFLGIRFIFIPAQNKFLYYELFSQYPKVHFSDGLIGKVFGLFYPYNGSIGQTAYAYMYRGDLYQSNSNTGYFGDSYAQFGFIGMIIMSIFLAYIIKSINSISNGLSYTVLATVLGVQIVILNDGTLLTTLLTYGFAVLLGLIFVYSRPGANVMLRRDLK